MSLPISNNNLNPYKPYGVSLYHQIKGALCYNNIDQAIQLATNYLRSIKCENSFPNAQQRLFELGQEYRSQKFIDAISQIDDNISRSFSQQPIRQNYNHLTDQGYEYSSPIHHEPNYNPSTETQSTNKYASLEDAFNGISFALTNSNSSKTNLSRPFSQQLISQNYNHLTDQGYEYSSPIHHEPNYNPSTEPQFTDNYASLEEAYSDTSPAITNSIFNKTNVHELLASNTISNNSKDIISSLAPFVGNVVIKNMYSTQQFGTCLLISRNLVLLPLHCVKHFISENMIVNLNINFLSDNLTETEVYNVNRIVKFDEKMDLLILQLSEDRLLDNIPEFADSARDDKYLFLLQYPESGNGNLHVSGNEAQFKTWQGCSLVTLHDSSSGSSGGIYANLRGEIVAIHIGTDKRLSLMFEIQKYAHIYTGMVCGNWITTNLYEFLDPEGAKSKPELITLLEQAIQAGTVPQQIKNDINAIIREYKKTGNYPGVTKHLKNIKDGIDDGVGNFIHEIIIANSYKFRGIAKNHSETCQWSIEYAVDSEHPLPHDVFKKTTNQVLKAYIKGGGERPGAGYMPAITIEHKIHRQLPTTCRKDKSFCDEILKLCNEHKIPHALEKILDSYAKYNLMTTTYKAGLLKLFNTPDKYYKLIVKRDKIWCVNKYIEDLKQDLKSNNLLFKTPVNLKLYKVLLDTRVFRKFNKQQFEKTSHYQQILSNNKIPLGIILQYTNLILDVRDKMSSLVKRIEDIK